MELRRLGKTDLQVSAICLGTMTYGLQNTEAEAHRQMDMAVEAGVNFFDAAEVYPMPSAPATFGRTEEHVGSWLAARGSRDRIVLATKVAGRSAMQHVRGGDARLDRANIVQALDDSLRRLKTDYIDLYQTHWPDRVNNRFGPLDYRHAPSPLETPIAETLDVLGDLVRAGKIRQIGASNETPWGLARHLALAEFAGRQRIVSNQTAYSLLNRSFEVGMSEIALRETCGLIAYAPVAAGTLTGKYLDGAVPKGSRRDVDHRPSRYATPRADAAVRRYLEIAERFGVDVNRMAIAFVLRQPFVTAAIIGATSEAQLQNALEARSLKLSDELVAALDAAHLLDPNPCP
jgi:aryl-alcohol dehydrogenase-like predicted oxidoreductase